MKKQLLFIAFFQAMLLCAQSQTADRPIAANQVLFNNNTIRVFKTKQGGYGYDILFQNRLVIHQDKNPFTGSSDGLKNESDAYKIAKWQVLQIRPNSSPVQLYMKRIPIEVAHQLKIEIANPSN